MQRLSALSSLSAGLLLLLGACASDTPDPIGGAKGCLVARVKTDATVHDAVPLTKSGAATKVPDSDELSLTLTKADGTFADKWSSVSEFPVDRQFAIGAYTLEAAYGTPESEGFDAPYFYGVADVHIIEGETTEATVTAKLANTMVSMDYTEAFKSFFKEYSGQLHAAGGDYIEMTADETRPAYLRTGNVTVTLSIVKQNGLSATVEAASFEALPQHHYHLTLDVNNGETGEGALVVRFDDSVVQEDVEIDMSDSFLLAPAPTVSAKGFTDGQTLDIMEGTRPEQAAFVGVVPGVIKSATLTTQSAELLAKGFPAEIDLMQATPEQKTQLTSLGLKVTGLWGNSPDKIAIIDMADVISTLAQSGETSFALVMKDKLGKVNLPVTLNVNTQAVNMEVTEIPSIYIDETAASLTVSYPGENFIDNVQLETQNAAGDWVKTAFTSSAAGTNVYRLAFQVPSAYRDIPVRLLFNGRVKANATLHKKGVIPTVDNLDVYAHRATVSLEKNIAASASDIAIFYETGTGTWTKATSVSFDASGKTATVSGLPDGTAVTLKASDNGQLDGCYKAVSFTTEKELILPNNKMDEWYENKAGSYYSVFWPGASADAAVWGTNNPMTTSQGVDTGYCRKSGTQQSTDARSGSAAKITSVGWGEGNTAWRNSIEGSAKCKYRDVGLLHLGSSRSVREDAQYDESGIAFASRPTALTFYCKYSPYNSEDYGQVVVKLYDASGRVIADGSKNLSGMTDYTQVSVPLSYKIKAKAAKIYVRFVSSVESRFMEKKDANFSHPKSMVISQLAGYEGSSLYIDDIVLTY